MLTYFFQEFDGHNADRKVMMNFGKQVYTRATVWVLFLLRIFYENYYIN